MDNSRRERVSASGSRMMHGGFVGVRPLESAEQRLVDALIDTLIPPEDGWPAAESLGISALLTSYLVPEESPVSLYPHFTRDEFPGIARLLLGEAADGGLDERVAALQTAEEADPALFARVRDFVYYVYYGHPAVVALIQSTTRYGRDYRGGSQPEGYIDSLEDWGDRPLVTRGVFIPTDRVLRAPQAKEIA